MMLPPCDRNALSSLRDRHSDLGTTSTTKAPRTITGNRTHEGPSEPSGSLSLSPSAMAVTTVTTPITTATPTRSPYARRFTTGHSRGERPRCQDFRDVRGGWGRGPAAGPRPPLLPVPPRLRHAPPRRHRRRRSAGP